MLDQSLIKYRKGDDHLQTRARWPRNLPPNFALYCDWLFWDHHHTYAPTEIAPRVIYVRSEVDMLARFANEYLDRIETPFALVTTSHDLPMPLGFGREHEVNWRRFVDHPLLRVWFTENRDLEHPLIKPLPLGLPSPDLPSWILGSERDDAVWTPEFFRWATALNPDKALRIFGSWRSRAGHPSGTCPEGSDERTLALRHFKTKPDLFAWCEPNLSRRAYIETMASYQFTLCPHGGGLDPNPRCWEALIVKTIPIVQRNTMTEALRHLPVAVVDDWSEVTPERLQSWKAEFEPGFNDESLEHKMSNRYFYEQILADLELTGA